MIITKNWINEWIDIEEKSSEEVCKTLNSIGLEVDSLTKVKIPKSVVVGYVKSCKKHPDADKLSVCEVDVGKETLQIVCGAKNVKEGQFVPVALVGCKFGEGFVIKKAKLRGVESNGMICSSTEIGLPEINDGILELDESIGELILGKELSDYKLLNDDIIEIELTANRGDCLSLYGVARDLGAAYKKELKYIEDEEKEDGSLGIGRVLSLVSKDDNYSTLLYRVFSKKSLQANLLLKLRLSFVGKKSENIFDIYKNYANHSTGVIIKFYSFNKCEIDGKCTIELKKDKHGAEYIKMGDKSSYIGFDEDESLKPDIEDELIVAEASYVPPSVISKIGKDIKVKSDDKTFYQASRGSEPNLEFGMKLLKNILDKFGELDWYNGSEVIDNRPNEKTVNIYLSKVNALIGQEFKKSDIVSILKSLGFGVEVKDEFDLISVKVPLYRHDIENEQDIVEEIVRITGIDNIKSSPMKIVESNNQNSALKNYKKRVYFREKASSSGYFEIINYLFTDSNKLKALGFDRVEKDKELLNPVTNELDALRTTLLVGLLESASRNVKYGKKSIKLFEIGTVLDSKRVESTKISFVFSGEVSRAAIRNSGKPKVVDFFTFAQSISSVIGDFEIVESKKSFEFLSPYESGEIVFNNETIGYIGRVHPKVQDVYDLPKSYICEIEFDKLQLEDKIVKPYSKYPSLERDFSFVVAKERRFAEIKKIILLVLPKEIIDFYPIDVYDMGDSLSVTVRFILQSDEKTLNDEDIEAILQVVLDKLANEGIKLR